MPRSTSWQAASGKLHKTLGWADRPHLATWSHYTQRIFPLVLRGTRRAPEVRVNTQHGVGMHDGALAGSPPRALHMLFARASDRPGCIG